MQHLATVQNVDMPPIHLSDEWQQSRHLQRVVLVIPVDSSMTSLGPGQRSWDQESESSVLTGQREIALLKQIYTFRRAAEVAEFLEECTFLIPLLFEAYVNIEGQFGHSPQVFLEVISDPEKADYEELFAFIATSLPPEEALKKLDRLDEEWWLAAMDRAQGNLCVHVEFQ